MTTINQMKIDVNLLKTEMGVEVVDDGNGHLSEGDMVIHRSNGHMARHTVSGEDFESADSVTKLLNQFSGNRTKIKVLFDAQKTQAYIASAAVHNSKYVRVYRVEEGPDQVMVKTGPAIAFNYSSSNLNQGLLGSQGAVLNLGPSAQGFMVEKDSPEDVCDRKKTDAEKLKCFQEIDARQQKSEVRAKKAAQLSRLKHHIREGIINDRMSLNLINQYYEISQELLKM